MTDEALKPFIADMYEAMQSAPDRYSDDEGSEFIIFDKDQHHLEISVNKDDGCIDIFYSDRYDDKRCWTLEAMFPKDRAGETP